MIVISNNLTFELDGDSAVAIGKFDGVHIGHQKLVEEINHAKNNGLKAVIFTFDPPPNQFFHFTTTGELSTKEEKRKLFEQLGVDVLIEYPLTNETAMMDPVDFVQEILIKQIHAKKIVAGKDISFGYLGKGRVELLLELQSYYQYEISIVEKLCYDEIEISSTVIRNEVSKGEMEIVQQLIGRPYAVDGIIVKGNQIGRTIDIPTINIHPNEEKLLPPYGVYFSNIIFERNPETVYVGISNIGEKPTVTDERRVGVETFLFDFQEDVYGEKVRVELLHFKRPEKRFDTIEKLKEQILEDKLVAKTYFSL